MVNMHIQCIPFIMLVLNGLFYRQIMLYIGHFYKRIKRKYLFSYNSFVKSHCKNWSHNMTMCIQIHVIMKYVIKGLHCICQNAYTDNLLNDIFLTPYTDNLLNDIFLTPAC